MAVSIKGGKGSPVFSDGYSTPEISELPEFQKFCMELRKYFEARPKTEFTIGTLKRNGFRSKVLSHKIVSEQQYESWILEALDRLTGVFITKTADIAPSKWKHGFEPIVWATTSVGRSYPRKQFNSGLAKKHVTPASQKLKARTKGVTNEANVQQQNLP